MKLQNVEELQALLDSTVIQSSPHQIRWVSRDSGDPVFSLVPSIDYSLAAPTAIVLVEGRIWVASVLVYPDIPGLRSDEKLQVKVLSLLADTLKYNGIWCYSIHQRGARLTFQRPEEHPERWRAMLGVGTRPLLIFETEVPAEEMEHYRKPYRLVTYRNRRFTVTLVPTGIPFQHVEHVVEAILPSVYQHIAGEEYRLAHQSAVEEE